jgi:hypothetical protein
VGQRDKDRDRTHQTGTEQTGSGRPGTGTTGTTDQDWQHDPKEDRKGSTTDMEQGDRTGPAQPDGTRPLERDKQPINQNKTMNQNR